VVPTRTRRPGPGVCPVTTPDRAGYRLRLRATASMPASNARSWATRSGNPTRSGTRAAAPADRLPMPPHRSPQQGRVGGGVGGGDPGIGLGPITSERAAPPPLRGGAGTSWDPGTVGRQSDVSGWARSGGWRCCPFGYGSGARVLAVVFCTAAPPFHHRLCRGGRARPPRVLRFPGRGGVPWWPPGAGGWPYHGPVPGGAHHRHSRRSGTSINRRRGPRSGGWSPAVPAAPRGSGGATGPGPEVEHGSHRSGSQNVTRERSMMTGREFGGRAASTASTN
jgi:hypothetical protein